MQTVVPTHLKLKGTLEDKVFVDSNTYRYHWRKRPLTAKASLRALKQESKRASLINKLAGDLNAVIKVHMGGFKSKDFYHRLLKKFRRESIDNRFLLLRQAEKMFIDEEYPKRELGAYDYEIKATETEIQIDIHATEHFTKSYGGRKDCYYYEVLLITWSKKKQPPYHSRQGSGWIQTPGPLPNLSFKFSLPNPATQWLLCVGHRSGVNNVLDPSELNRSMQIIEAGTFEEKDLEALKLSKPYVPKWERSNPVITQEVDVWVEPRFEGD
jgi:hypothetical protein